MQFRLKRYEINNEEDLRNILDKIIETEVNVMFVRHMFTQVI